jgi:uncharacterized protein YbjT (DUF2867 family)
MASRKVIVFGPTGAVGSAAARTAAELGAKVVLAMRNTEKSIPGLDKENEGNFERVYADLLKPDTVRDAVAKTGAQHAFIYCAWGSPDKMKSTIQALKSAGIELLVILSSYTIQGDPKEIQPSEIIPYGHAQIELTAREIYGENEFVAIRPGYFASNMARYAAELAKNEVKLFRPEITLDCIVQEDIGRVCGTVLAEGPQDDERIIYLYGPELLTQEDCIKIIATALEKTPKIVAVEEKDANRYFVEELGMPSHVAKYIKGQSSKAVAGQSQVFGYPVREGQLSNIEKYSKKKATRFEEWAEKNKQLFIS